MLIIFILIVALTLADGAFGGTKPKSHISDKFVAPRKNPSPKEDCSKYKPKGADIVKTNWREHFFVFVGGCHRTGTSVTEKILSSQVLSAGLNADAGTHDTSGCRKNAKAVRVKSSCHCFAPENEGVFLTNAFDQFRKDLGTHCEHGNSLWGNKCAAKSYLDEHHAQSVTNEKGPLSGKKYFPFADVIFKDWSKFWTNLNAPYLVEKDIANTVQSTFLQALFGRERSAFVFVLKHPVALCPFFKCNLEDMLASTFKIYDMVASDVNKLSHFVVYQYEGLVAAPAEVLYHIDSVVGMSSVRDVGNMSFRLNDPNVMPGIADDEMIDVNHQYGIVRTTKKHLDVNSNSDHRDHRQLGYHQANKRNGYKTPISIMPSKSALYWRGNYSRLFDSNGKARTILKKYEKKLNSFGYRIDNLLPINYDPAYGDGIPRDHHTFEHPYIWKKSSKSLRLPSDEVTARQVKHMVDKKKKHASS